MYENSKKAIRKSGEMVLSEEVIGYAKSSCNHCYGRGTQTYEVEGQPVSKICSCAIRKFMRKHLGEISPTLGGFKWR